jgi:hypothetical protein
VPSVGFAEAVDDDAGAVEGGVGLAERRDDAVAAAFGWAEVHEDHLVDLVVDDAAQAVAAAREVGGGELALEDGVLEPVAEARMVLWTLCRRRSSQMS